jgi:hypothetical protein
MAWDPTAARTASSESDREPLLEEPDALGWAHLTRLPLKAQLYRRETWFRDGLTDAVEVLGEHMPSVLRRAALLVVKPDGLVAGKAAVATEFLRERGFELAAVETPTFDRFVWRELWRYQLTCATLDRLAVNEIVLSGCALLLALRHSGELRVPASVWLSSLKGPADVTAQTPDCLRRRLAQPNRVLSYIHVSDEPADVLRELAILLDAETRRRVLAALAGGEPSEAERAALAEAITAPARPIDAKAALARAAVVASTRAQSAAAARIAADLARMQRGENIAWRPFVRALHESGAALDRWDLAALGTTYIVYDEPGTSKQLVGVDPALWAQPPVAAP